MGSTMKLLLFVALVANMLLTIPAREVSKAAQSDSSASSNSGGSGTSSSSSTNASHDELQKSSKNSSDDCEENDSDQTDKNSSGRSKDESSKKSRDKNSSPSEGKSQKKSKNSSEECDENDSNNHGCKANEEYVECPDYVCRPKSCSEVGFPVACPDQAPGSTCPKKPACICVEGHVRNKKGVCVPMKECPSCGGDKNAETGCGNPCGRTCALYDKGPIFCRAKCRYNACDCKPDYVYDDQTQKCVLPKDCTPTCGDNEMYSNCTNDGSEMKCSEIGKPTKCEKVKSKHCKEGCVCQDGFYRNDAGACVPKEQCPDNHGCKANEEYVECPDYVCRPKYCSEVGFPVSCPDQAPGSTCPTKPACICIEGHVRNKKGVCVPMKECPSCGGDENAQSGCGINCGRHCSDYDKGPVYCRRACFYNACDCKPDYVYDDQTQKCVLPKDCTPTCGDNEMYSNCTNDGSEMKCSEIGKPTKCEKVKPKHCKEGCVCQDGFYRNDTGACVPKEQCPETCPGKNEVFNECPPICPPRLCGVDPAVVLCLPNPEVGDPKCQPGCQCIDGHVRNDQGICVTPDQCPVCRSDEYYSSCASNGCDGPRNCSQIGQPGICVENMPEKDCRGACLCNGGNLRDDEDGTCIPRDQCPNTNLTCSGPNEFFACGSACDNVCADLATQNQTNCPIKNKTCNKKCYCKEGYARDSKNICIPIDKCPVKCPGPHEFFSCGGACDNVCADLSTQNQTNCPIVNIKCNEKCYCEEGYARNESNICIPIEQCPETTTTCNGDPNAHPGCCGKLCSNYNNTKPVVCNKFCIKGACACNDGYYLDSNTGLCVRPENCTLQCTNDNEFYDACPPSCSPETCDSIGKKHHCPLQTTVCKPACRCKSGYYRNSEGTCIPKDQCNQTTSCNGDPNARPGCGVNCGKLCSNYNSTEPVLCPLICNVDGCDCNDGYVFDPNTGVCVRPEQCTPQCDRNEFYDSCPPSCSPETCDSIGKEYDCPIQTTVCKPACRCLPGYYRNCKGTCVPRNECNKTTTCNGDPNAVPGCGVNCGRLCTNYNSTDGVACIQVCYENGCDCKEGYVLDTNTGYCVLPKQCSPACGVNEQYSTCTQSLCRAQDCTQRGQSVPCIRMDPKYCKKGCVCIENHLRNSKGKCVPENQCDICPKGEIFNKCSPQKCDAEYCPKSRHSPTACSSTKQCGEPRCTCEFNKKRERKSGKCIDIKNCPPFKCNKCNEEYDACPPLCPGEKCADYINNSTCPKPGKIGIDFPCTPACRCKKNHYRNSEGECVTGKQCKKEVMTTPPPPKTTTKAPGTPPPPKTTTTTSTTCAPTQKPNPDDEKEE